MNHLLQPQGSATGLYNGTSASYGIHRLPDCSISSIDLAAVYVSHPTKTVSIPRLLVRAEQECISNLECGGCGPCGGLFQPVQEVIRMK